MALRVAVNDELAAIEEFLPAALSSLKPHGRLVLISYDSLQDRRVKDFLKGEGRGCVCPPKFPVCVCGKLPEIAILTKKVVRPDEDEVKINPRSRSAKLRAAEKLPKE
jgi:16S rRNA (cytosine1402-N4)-methyltransferase